MTRQQARGPARVGVGGARVLEFPARPARGAEAEHEAVQARVGGAHPRQVRRALVNKDLRYSTRLLDFYLGLIIAVWAALYFAFVEDASPHVARVTLMGVLLFNLIAAFNYFGFETATGFDRDGFLPLRGRDVIASKKLFFVLLVAAQLCPVILLASWRSWPAEGLFGVDRAGPVVAGCRRHQRSSSARAHTPRAITTRGVTSTPRASSSGSRRTEAGDAVR